MDLSNIYDESLRDALRGLEARALNHLTINPVLAVATTTTKFKLSAFSYRLAGVTYNKAAADNIAFPGASTTSGQFRKVLICVDAAQAITTVAGAVAATAAAAVLPSPTAGTLPIGYLELPESFTSGTTDVTSGMCKALTELVDVTYGND